ncbi:hypothetical protein LEMA_P081220.1 [Plenodomus lingam JN3]|uniref:Uncharacterized protein n=1 Tax=Leptosphaeria maculans (strain JN3 / isolate v23.1.3 / race Av1-4-5-6-7-8) TaxID=985895 RepID=E5A5I5_LEPMJ|nr:hypothetical protein LEMA_P081220.1 [Plenodomus lingam JN3]CBX98883.1 hypothetical protein LEMA_P081220.1 [Plenodomus lingam JN3]
MYDSAAYNSLPSLRSAASLVDDTVRAHLTGPVRKLFLECNAHEQYGIVLLHKHFAIADGERLVEYRSSSTAWKVGHEQTDIVAQYEGKIVPRSYRLYNGAAVPYEFGYYQEAPRLNNTFQTMALKVLKDLGLDQIFGLRCLDEYDPSLSIEVTEGKTNIMLVRGSVPEDELIEAEHCWPRKDGHVQDHSCG